MVAAIAALSLSSANAGMQVSPIIMEIPNQPGSTGSIRVQNTGPKEIPVAISVVERTLDATGKLVNRPADADFVVFPPQAVINGRDAQQFRFQFIGNGDLGKSASYYLFATQLPVDLDAEETNTGFQARLNFLYEYGVAVHAVPSDARPQLDVEHARAVKLPDGRPGVELTITNNGNRFGRASEHELQINYASGSESYSPAKLKKGLKSGMWLPGQTHIVKFPVKKQPKNIEAVFEYVGG